MNMYQPQLLGLVPYLVAGHVGVNIARVHMVHDVVRVRVLNWVKRTPECVFDLQDKLKACQPGQIPVAGSW